MAQLVKLTDTLDDTIWVNPDAVMLVEPRYTTNGIHGTQITLQSGREIGVEEKMETVVEKIGENAGAVPVVRCRDCKYGEMRKNYYGDDMVECSNPDSPVRDYALTALFRPDWFCADGERKQE